MEGACLLVIQSDFSHADGDLIACARYRIYDERAKALLQIEAGISHPTHVLFLIHLPVHTVRSSFVGFQGDPWVSCHIDELRRGSEGGFSLEDARGATISEIFYGGPGINRFFSVDTEGESMGFFQGEEEEMFQRVSSEEGEDITMEEEEDAKKEEELEKVEEEEEESMEADLVEKEGHLRVPVQHKGTIQKFPQQCTRLKSCIQASASMLQASTHNKQRATKRVELLINLIPPKTQFPLG